MAELISRGTEFWVDKTGSGTFTKIAQIRSIEHAGRAADIVEFNDLDMTAKRRRPGLPDPGSYSLTVNLDPQNAEHKFLETQADAPEVLDYRLVYTQVTPAEIRDFEAFVSGFDSGGGENQDPLEATIAIQVAGAITPSVEDD